MLLSTIDVEDGMLVEGDRRSALTVNFSCLLELIGLGLLLRLRRAAVPPRLSVTSDRIEEKKKRRDREGDSRFLQTVERSAHTHHELSREAYKDMYTANIEVDHLAVKGYRIA